MRALLKNTLYLVCFWSRNLLDPLFHFQEISVLAYHSLSVDSSVTSILPEIFEEHLRILKNNGVSFVSVPDVVGWRRKKIVLPRKAVAITFDDGYADFESAALPLLEKYQVPVTLFFLGSSESSRVALGNDQPLLSPSAIRRLEEHPLVTLGYHSYSHGNFARLPKNSTDLLQTEVTSPIPVAYFAFPGGNYSKASLAAVHDAGYEAGFSIKPTLVSRHSPRYLMPRSVITKDHRPWEVLLRTTKAISWYRRLTRPI